MTIVKECNISEPIHKFQTLNVCKKKKKDEITSIY